MRIGLIASSGGAVFKTVKQILDKCSKQQHQFYVIVDRRCSIYDFCIENNIEAQLIIESDNARFSQNAFKLFRHQWDVAVVCLFYSRLVTEALFSNILTVNFHPSLLPHYKGFEAIEQAIHDGYSQLGATLHVVDESIDGGPILGQLTTPITLQMKNQPSKAHTASYVQKVYLMLLLIDKLEGVEISIGKEKLAQLLISKLDEPRAIPPYHLTQAYYEQVVCVQNVENLEVI
ncbi:formyl transferase-like protein [Paraglaciecola sp. T6c]|uniref:formyltransferase family protein n=1 Tax=Pseudoalteromonas atlantica (strain T6c / ATCC BAA-1087) TaxID=3042615 RepID=UPI00005C60BF|nr:formyltransferase family protein [Paraglaciecola sp. T6c]ABG41563.1 formyl transferase-like protein [Paraglaciecola sp. T6c]